MKKEDFIFGIHPVLEAIEAGREIEKVLIQKNLNPQSVGQLRAMLNERDIPFQHVPLEKLNRVTRKNHQGVIAFISPIVYEDIEKYLPEVFEQGRNPFILILDRITDVRNFGAIARTAECAGVDAIIVPARGAALINGDAVKTSAGALNRIRVCRAFKLKETIDYLKMSGLKIFSVTEKAEDAYYQQNFKEPLAIIMGSEEDGISPAYLEMSDAMLQIPMAGSISSLNVSVATGIVLFEALRQRGV